MRHSCVGGFYQPVDDNNGMDMTGPGKPCLPGFFCPKDFACTIMCPFGSICANSTLSGSKCKVDTFAYSSACTLAFAKLNKPPKLNFTLTHA